MGPQELARHILRMYETHELEEAITEALQSERDHAEQIREAAMSILWMAEKWAEGAGPYSQEMEDYKRARSLLGRTALATAQEGRG